VAPMLPADHSSRDMRTRMMSADRSNRNMLTCSARSETRSLAHGLAWDGLRSFITSRFGRGVDRRDLLLRRQSSVDCGPLRHVGLATGHMIARRKGSHVISCPPFVPPAPLATLFS
jgi:hypothetical protein